MTLWRDGCTITPPSWMCAIVTAEIQEPNDGSNCSALLHGETSVRGSVEHFWRWHATIRTGRHRNQSRPGDYLRHREIFAEIPQSHHTAQLLFCRGVGWRADGAI